MTDSDILKAYFTYRDSLDEQGNPMFTDQEIQEEFSEFGININQKLQEMSDLTPEQIQEMTSGAYTEPEDVETSVAEGIWDVSQQALQGMTFGYADEVEAKLRALAKGTDYKDEIEEVRGEIEAFRKENPGMAFTAEMAGAFLIPGFATTKLIQMAPKLGKFKEGERLFNAMKRSVVGATAGTVEGGLYGAGVAQEGERIEGAKQGAFWGSIMGAGLGPTLGWFTDAIAGRLSSKVGQKGDEMVDLDGNVVITPSKPEAQKKAQDLMIRAAQIDDVGGLQKLQETLNEYIETMPDVLKNMTFAQLYPEGGFGQGLAELLAKTPGRGMAASRAVYDKISTELPGKARNLIKKALGPRVADVEEFKKFLVKRATKKARPFYQKAEPELVDVPQLIAHVKRLMGPVKSPDTVGKLVREALANTRLNLPRELKKKGIDAPNWGKSGPYNNSPILHWDSFKQELDTIIKRVTKDSSTSNKNVGELEALYSDITKTIGDLNPDYKKATGIHVSKHKYTKAFEDGLKAHTDKSITPEFMLKQIKGLQGREGGGTTPEEMMYRLGYAFGMYKKVLTKSSKTGKDPKAMLDLFSEDQPEKMRALFKDEKVADLFLEQINVLSQASASANRFRYGSPTFPLQAMQQMVEETNDPGIIKKIIDEVKDWGGSKKGMDDMMDSPTQRTTDASAAMMTKQGPEEMQRILDSLKARELEKMKRGTFTMGAGYPTGATGAMSPLYGGEDRNSLSYEDREYDETGEEIIPRDRFGRVQGRRTYPGVLSTPYDYGMGGLRRMSNLPSLLF